MKILKLPHRTADYLCPVNGLADFYEWKTGVRIPEQLLFYARSGFMLISNKKAVASEDDLFFRPAASAGSSTNSGGGMMDFALHSGEGKTFGNALREIRALIDREIPVIIFGLDMYHLGYQEKFYHRMHVPGTYRADGRL